jgi:hypothetical protein
MRTHVPGTLPRLVADPWPDRAASPEWLPLRLPWRASPLPSSPPPSLRSISPVPDDDELHSRLDAWERVATPDDAHDASDEGEFSPRPHDTADGPEVRIWLCGDATPAPLAQKRSAKGSAASFDSDNDGASNDARAEAAVPSKPAAMEAGASTATSPAPTLV